MEDLKAFAKRLRKNFFPIEEDDAWKQWVDFKNRGYQDLVNLLSSDVGDGFKKRALFLLIAPPVHFNVLYWKKETYKYLPERYDFIRKLSADQLNFATDLIIKFYSAWKLAYLDEAKSLFMEGKGSTVQNPVLSELRNTLHFYNTCIMHLLALLPEEKAEKIFPLFLLTEDLSPSRGYRPFSDLMRDRRIDEKWKKAADSRIREIILSEISGRKPIEGRRATIEEYADIVAETLDDKLKYSVELYISQIRFIMDNSGGQGGLIDNCHAINIFVFFSRKKHKAFRRTLAEYLLLEKVEGFSRFAIYDGGDQWLARRILKEFGDDHRFVDRVKELNEERDWRRAKEKAFQTEKKAAEDRILAQMR